MCLNLICGDEIKMKYKVGDKIKIINYDNRDTRIPYLTKGKEYTIIKVEEAAAFINRDYRIVVNNDFGNAWYINATCVKLLKKKKNFPKEVL